MSSAWEQDGLLDDLRLWWIEALSPIWPEPLLDAMAISLEVCALAYNRERGKLKLYLKT